jgi:hypothetical protein
MFVTRRAPKRLKIDDHSRPTMTRERRSWLGVWGKGRRRRAKAPNVRQGESDDVSSRKNETSPPGYRITTPFSERARRCADCRADWVATCGVIEVGGAARAIIDPRYASPLGIQDDSAFRWRFDSLFLGPRNGDSHFMQGFARALADVGERMGGFSFEMTGVSANARGHFRSVSMSENR